MTQAKKTTKAQTEEPTLYVVTKNFCYEDSDGNHVRVNRSSEPQQLSSEALTLAKKVKAIK